MGYFGIKLSVVTETDTETVLCKFNRTETAVFSFKPKRKIPKMKNFKGNYIRHRCIAAARNCPLNLKRFCAKKRISIIFKSISIIFSCFMPLQPR